MDPGTETAHSTVVFTFEGVGVTFSEELLRLQ